MPFYTEKRVVIFFVLGKTLKLSYSLLPRRCKLSNKWIWLEQAYKAKIVYRGWAEDPIWVQNAWIRKDTFLWARLNDAINIH